MALIADNTTIFSLEQLLNLRREAFALLRVRFAEIASIGNALETLDAQLQIALAVRGGDEQQALINAARHLSSLLDGSVFTTEQTMAELRASCTCGFLVVQDVTRQMQFPVVGGDQ